VKEEEEEEEKEEETEEVSRHPRRDTHALSVFK
jgi:hypothetical protein